MTYSVAIRTLGTSGEMFRRELISLKAQTIQPEKIVVYIAEGYKRPDYQIGKEEYVWVKKGLVAQRALQYREIESEYILLLDDDVELQPNSVELLLGAAVKNDADVIAADTFRTHELPLKSKIAAMITNWVFPHWNQNWAFRLHWHGSFSYLNNPKKDVYPTQSCAGPASLWKKSTRLALHAEDEVIFDSLKHMTEDQAMFGKVYFSGYRMFVHYNCGIVHLDAGVNSRNYDNDPERFFYRSRRLFVLWWRTIYEPSRVKPVVAFIYFWKIIWLFMVNLGAAIYMRHFSIPRHYINGIMDGWRFVHSMEYQNVPKFLAYKKSV